MSKHGPQNVLVWTDEMNERLKEMLERGETLVNAGDALGVAHNSARKQAIKLGISRRTYPKNVYESRWDFDRLPDEEWRPIPGSEFGHASNMGRVLSNRGLVKPFNHQLGYKLVSIDLNGKRTTKTLHSVIAMTFLGPRPEGLDIAHSDNDKTNNRADNLRYCSRHNNIADGRKSESKIKVIRTPEMITALYERMQQPDAVLSDFAKEVGHHHQTLWAIYNDIRKYGYDVMMERTRR